MHNNNFQLEAVKYSSHNIYCFGLQYVIIMSFGYFR